MNDLFHSCELSGKCNQKGTEFDTCHLSFDVPMNLQCFMTILILTSSVRSSLRKHVPQPIHPNTPLLVSSYVHPRIISLLISTIWQVEWQIRTGLSGTPPPGHREFLSPSTFSSPSNQPECISSTCQQRHFHMKADKPRREGSSDLEEKWKFKGTFFVKVKVKGTPQWSPI